MTLTLIILGIVILICGGFYELRTKREALFPRAIFNNLTTGKKMKAKLRETQLRFSTGIILVVTFLHNFAFNAGTFYLALYFQVREARVITDVG